MRRKDKDKTFPNICQIIVAMDGNVKEKLVENAKKFGVKTAPNLVRRLVYYYGLYHPENVDWESLIKETEQLNAEMRKSLYDRQKTYKAKNAKKTEESAQ